MNIGIITYSLLCPAPPRLFAKIKSEKIEAYNISQSGESITLSVSCFQKRRFERICRELKTEYKIISVNGLYRLLGLLKKRLGLAVGAAVCAAFMLIVQNYAISIEVLTDDDEIRKDVMTVLYDNGIKPWTYIPSIDYINVERALKQSVDGISWAGISITDSTIIVDVIENIPEPQKHYERMPSDLIATHNAVIEEVELYNGQLVKTIGSGVLRGETIVSGTVVKEQTKVVDGELVTEQNEKYVRSIGRIFGTYTDVQTFEQPLTDTKIVVSGKEISKNYLSVFNTEIPLFLKNLNGFYTEDEQYKPLKIFGEETPVGICTKTYNKYSFEKVIYTKEQAKALADEMRKKYEQNFLYECEIRSRKTDVKYTENSVVLTVTYEIYGQISEESQFFIKK